MKNLKKYRKDKGLTQKELADCVGLNVISIVRYELGHTTPSVDLARKIADFFEVKIEDLD